MQTSQTPSVKMFRRKLIEVMRKKRVSQTELAERSGICRETINRIIHQEQSIRLDTADRICHALDISLITLIS